MMNTCRKRSFLYKDWRRVLCRRWESGAVECSLTCQKSWRKIFCRKNEKNQNTC